MNLIRIEFSECELRRGAWLP